MNDARQAESRDQVEKGAACLSILLIEDNPGDADLVSKYLSETGPAKYELHHAERLSPALVLVHDRRFQVVLADLSLPDARGVDAVMRIYTAAPKTAIIVLSGMNDEALALQTVQLGAQDYLVKGQVDAPTLHRSIRYATERKRAEQHLAHLAHYDQLTGLANQVTFRDQLSQALARASRQNTLLAVMFLDLDRFKTVNDGLGHDVGDSLLQEIGKRLQAAVREYDTIARLGGDEFAVLVPDINDKAIPTRLAQRILGGLTAPITLKGSEVVVTCSIGVALFPDAGESSEDLLRSADIAMYAAKEAGRDNFQIFAVEDGQRALPRLRLERDLRQAVQRNEFVLHYQPQVDLRTNCVVGLEALLRWQRPDGSLVAPAQFVPSLEETGLIVDVGKWVIWTACMQLREWRETSRPNLRIAVNLSARQFEQDGLIDAVQGAIQEAGVLPGSIELEITESLLMRCTEKSNKSLSRLKDIGVRTAIDDFGTRYSSLAYLHRFSVDTLEIDRSFVQAIAQGKDGAFIASAIVGLGHKLGLEVIAEGVETQEQLAFLREDGCDVIQGYLVGRPSGRWIPAQDPVPVASGIGAT